MWRIKNIDPYKRLFSHVTKQGIMCNSDCDFSEAYFFYEMKLPVVSFSTTTKNIILGSNTRFKDCSKKRQLSNYFWSKGKLEDYLYRGTVFIKLEVFLISFFWFITFETKPFSSRHLHFSYRTLGSCKFKTRESMTIF